MPLVIRARAIRSPSSKETPTNESEPSPAVAGAVNSPSSSPFGPVSFSFAEPSASTSVKTTPKPFVLAGVSVPGTRNRVSVIVLSIGTNRRCAEKVANTFSKSLF